jgi:hypothetical protein
MIGASSRIEDTAAALGLKPKTIYARRARIVEQLRKLLS